MKALIVDDSMINLKVEKRILETLGLEVDIVLSGKECLEKVKITHYDIIFMDIMMPEMDGVETFLELKKMPGFNTPVITLTADVLDGAKEKYLAEGFSEYLAKPLDINQLKIALNNLGINL